MTKDEIRKGFLQGRRLIQEEWSKPEEKNAVDELLAEGACCLEDDWRYHDNFQCERRVIIGIPAPPAPAPDGTSGGKDE